jgi:hypothetical protein
MFLIWKTLIKQSDWAHIQSGAFLASNGCLKTLQIDKPYASEYSTLLSTRRNVRSVRPNIVTLCLETEVQKWITAIT